MLASVLTGEHPKAIAVVLSELPAKKSSQVLSLLDEQLRLEVVTRMTGGESINPEAKRRIAQMICGRLESPAVEAAAAGQDESMRKVAVMLRNLGKEIKDGLLAGITQKDQEAAGRITQLMVIWEDLTEVTDRSLQEALRQVDSQKLALALINADETISGKIKSNISERAAATIEEETSLMSAPKKADIEDAREEVVAVLREMNEKGELNFIED